MAFKWFKKLMYRTSTLTSRRIMLFGTMGGATCAAFFHKQSSHCSRGHGEVRFLATGAPPVPSLAQIPVTSKRNYFPVKTSLLATSAIDSERLHESSLRSNTRSYTTEVDMHFQRTQQIPMPKNAHCSLDDLIHSENGDHEERTNKILVIGDVHGCLDELKSLVQKSINENNDRKSFAAIILVGDLCNKGPYSAEVIRYVRSQKNWFSVRGNHDNAALAAAVGDEKRRGQKKYEWLASLSDEDIQWLSELPYTITVPKSMFGTSCTLENDIIVVHAGLIPGIPLEQQDVRTMITIRDVIESSSEGDPAKTYMFCKKMGDDEYGDGSRQAWAKAWNGPQQIIFGHDAKRGCQQEEFAIGLDSGACYGKKLTGIILPGRDIVSVEAEKVHCPIK